MRVCCVVNSLAPAGHERHVHLPAMHHLAQSRLMADRRSSVQHADPACAFHPEAVVLALGAVVFEASNAQRDRPSQR